MKSHYFANLITMPAMAAAASSDRIPVAHFPSRIQRSCAFVSFAGTSIISVRTLPWTTVVSCTVTTTGTGIFCGLFLREWYSTPSTIEASLSARLVSRCDVVSFVWMYVDS